MVLEENLPSVLSCMETKSVCILDDSSSACAQQLSSFLVSVCHAKDFQKTFLEERKALSKETTSKGVCLSLIK